MHEHGVAGGVPGVVGRWVGRRGAIPVPSPNPPRIPIFSIFKAEGPTHGQIRLILEVSMRFLNKGPERVPE